jgi:hypothetical protein
MQYGDKLHNEAVNVQKIYSLLSMEFKQKPPQYDIVSEEKALYDKYPLLVTLGYVPEGELKDLVAEYTFYINKKG